MNYSRLFIQTGLFSLLLFLLQSCTLQYAMGNSGIDPIVFVKPVYKDSAQISTYIGGKFTHTLDSAYGHTNEINYLGQLNLSRTHIFKYYNFSYGIFGYTGNYKITRLDSYKGYKSYYGAGVSGELCSNIPLENTDLRLLGIKGTIFYENGEFSRFRKLAAKQLLISGATESLCAFNISVSSGCEVHLQKSSLGFDMSAGLTRYMGESPQFFTLSSNIHYTYKRCTGFLVITESVLGIGWEYGLGICWKLNK